MIVSKKPTKNTTLCNKSEDENVVWDKHQKLNGILFNKQPSFFFFKWFKTFLYIVKL